MMKKILVLILVLAMAPLANAVIISWSATNYTPGVACTITISMYSDEQIVGGCVARVTDFDAGGTANAPGTWGVKFTVQHDGGYSGLDVGLGKGELVIANGTVDIPAYATGTLFTYTYDVPATNAGTIHFKLLDYPDAGYVSSMFYMSGGKAIEYLMTDMTFDSVPEPMTIALLGLGGLFMLRRK